MKKLAYLFIILFAASQINAQKMYNGSVRTEETSPMATYTRLFVAVKAKNSEAIKNEMSLTSMKFALGVAEQRKQTVEQILKNGFYASTITDKLPKMRDEQIKDKFANLEVWVEKKQKWEDVNFVFENGDWKIAVGEVFAGTFKSPGLPKRVKSKIGKSKRGYKNSIPSASDLKKLRK
jgi:hypothetical protein